MTERKRPENLPAHTKKLWWALGLAAGLAIVLWALFAPGRGYLHYRRLQAELTKLSNEISQMETKNRDLIEEINRLKTDKAYLEEVARQKHGLLKKDETVFEFPPPKKKGKE